MGRKFIADPSTTITSRSLAVDLVVLTILNKLKITGAADYQAYMSPYQEDVIKRH